MTNNRKRKRYPRIKKKSQPSILFWSSLVLITNMWTAFLMGQYTYSFLFASLVISSLIVHSYSSIITNIWDKIWVGSVIIFGDIKYGKIRINQAYGFVFSHSYFVFGFIFMDL